MLRNILEVEKSNRPEDTELRTEIRAVLLALQLVALVLLVYETAKRVGDLSEGDIISITMNMLCMVIAFMFSLSMMRSRTQQSGVTAFLLIVFFDVMHLCSDGIFKTVNGYPEYRIWAIASNTIYLICPLMMTAIYWLMLDLWIERTGRNKKAADIFITITAFAGGLLAIGDAAFGYYSVFSEDGFYHRGKLYVLTIIIPFIMVLLCAVRIVKSRLTFTEKLVLLSYPIIPIVAAWAQHLTNLSFFVTTATFLSLVLVYTNFFKTREEELAILENQMTMSKLYSLQMQINPHMLFNTMSSIAGMCDIDPERAQDMIFKLSDYLRDNFTDIDKPTMVTLREELEHLDHYLAIEIMRFPNITVVKDIDRDDFLLPRMTLQPLVENAIKHGICKRRRAEGTLVIKASETEDAWVVSVRDDGVGFEGKVPEGSAEEHHGIYNVRTRLSILCDGTLEVDGEPGKGTISTVRIPKGEAVRKLAFDQ